MGDVDECFLIVGFDFVQVIDDGLCLLYELWVFELVVFVLLEQCVEVVIEGFCVEVCVQIGVIVDEQFQECGNVNGS